MDRHTDPQRHTSPGPLHGADLSGMAPAADVDLHAVNSVHRPRHCACGHPERIDRTHGKGICFKRDAVTDAAVTTIDDHNGAALTAAFTAAFTDIFTAADDHGDHSHRSDDRLDG